jgi:hypothetical protein
VPVSFAPATSGTATGGSIREAIQRKKHARIMQTINTAIFKSACAFTLTTRKMGNSRKGDMGKVQVDADKRCLRLSKQLIDSPEYETIIDYQRQVYNWCTSPALKHDLS